MRNSDTHGGPDAQGDPTLRRRRLLRGAGLAATGGLVGLAGCTGGDGGDSGDGSGGDEDTGTGTGSGGSGTGSDGSDGGDGGSTPVREEIGSVARNTVEELSIVGYTSRVEGGKFHVVVTVRNEGESTTDITEYSFSFTLYDESGKEFDVAGTSSTARSPETAPGETGSIDFRPIGEYDAEAVARYEIGLSCDGPFAEGVYCSTGTTEG